MSKSAVPGRPANLFVLGPCSGQRLLFFKIVDGYKNGTFEKVNEQLRALKKAPLRVGSYQKELATFTKAIRF